MTAAVAPRLLSQGELRIARLLALGKTNHEIADELGIALATVSVHRVSIRKKLGCPFRCSNAVLAHHLYESGEVSPPNAVTPVPELSGQEVGLIHAITERTRPYDIARTAHVAARDFHSTLAELLDKTGAANTAQLVAFAYAWSLLGKEPRQQPAIGNTQSD
ncbi:helix-turn-helix transcriptional regulator [Streptomyces sp. NBC_00820]|uniref:response regulator transcription factor n=1 Tax=Streptomyces sp. NBC_00820 TaxID=2975842 RepID=UPI002ED20CAF|nr:helix-turn-helix transcriptional regulator [Streptomyces sp. NBC_00820]